MHVELGGVEYVIESSRDTLRTITGCYSHLRMCVCMWSWGEWSM